MVEKYVKLSGGMFDDSYLDVFEPQGIFDELGSYTITIPDGTGTQTFEASVDRYGRVMVNHDD